MSASLLRIVGVVALAFVLSVPSTLTTPSPNAGAQELVKPVPKADCGPNDRTEGGLQGRTTFAERFAAGPAMAFNCNLELIGQYRGEGAGWGFNVTDNCAYFTTDFTATLPKIAQPGVRVVDVSDPRNPKLAKILNSPGMFNPNESMTISESRKLLVGMPTAPLSTILLGSGAGALPPGVEFPFDVYDVSDCRNPVLLSSTEAPGFQIHGGQFSADGLMYYGTVCCGLTAPKYSGPPSAAFAIDLTDPKNPREIASWVPEEKNLTTHWLSINEDATRAYVTPIRLDIRTDNLDGLVILDISDISAGRPNAQFHVISKTFWDDTQFGEYGAPFRQGGRHYFLHTDMTGSFPFGGGGDPSNCKGNPGWGYPRILDITDETNPTTVARLMLEVQDPVNCATIAYDPVASGGYSPAFCDFDNVQDVRLIACAFMEGGLRVFDVHDLANPREIAYYKPPAARAEIRLGSFQRPDRGPNTITADSVIRPIFRDDGREIWFSSMSNGFQVVRFPDRFLQSNGALFQP